MEWIDLAQDRGKYEALVMTVIVIRACFYGLNFCSFIYEGGSNENLKIVT